MEKQPRVMIDLSAEFWNNRYVENTHRWDLGGITPPLKAYIDQLENKELKILIPGGGNSYEAEYLFNKGFKNVIVIDLAETPLNNIKKRVPSFPSDQLIKGNFFDLDITFDLVLEQTFFCAINPNLRDVYVTKMKSILKPTGKLVGLLFDAPLNTEHPPFGGSKEEYVKRFTSSFKIKTMENCYNSHETRQGRELFVNMEMKL
ncbi:TPMT family class I SAM-dependent methyltransferase [Flavobacteriaceae bacterium]|nr:TPMT family class I SAM-dependent methyltransferase [Flavobacteriaceae bacterium]